MPGKSEMPSDLADVVRAKFEELAERAAARKKAKDGDGVEIRVHDVHLDEKTSKAVIEAVEKVLGRVSMEDRLVSLASKMAAHFREMMKGVTFAADMGNSLLNAMENATEKAVEAAKDGFSEGAQIATYNKVIREWLDDGMNLYQMAACAMVYCLAKYCEANADTEDEKDGDEEPDDEDSEPEAEKQAEPTTEGATNGAEPDSAECDE